MTNQIRRPKVTSCNRAVRERASVFGVRQEAKRHAALDSAGVERGRRCYSRGKIEFAVVSLIPTAAITIVVLQRQQVRRMAAENDALREQVRRAANLRQSDTHLITRLKSEVDSSEARTS